MVTIVILGVIIVIIFLYSHVTRHFNYWKNRNVPYIKPIPFIGNIFSIAIQKESLHSWLYGLYKSTTLPFIGFFVFDQPYILIRDPELIKNILVTNFDHFCERSVLYNKMDKYFSNSLFMINQPKWKVIRTKVRPTFSPAKLKNMVPLILKNGDDMVDYINGVCLGTGSANCREIVMTFALDVISCCAFGLRTNSQQNPKLVAVVRKLLGIDLSRAFQVASHFIAPFLVNMFHFTFIDANSAKYMEQIILKAIEERAEKKIHRSDLIDLLIEVQKEDPLVFDNQQVVALSINYLIAGYETSGAAMSFVLYELCLNISIQDRLRKEINSVLQKNRTITYQAIQEMTYLQMVIKEGLRKYPALQFLDRRCIKTFPIPNSDVVIDEGLPVYIPMMALHYDDKYFPNPHKFDPERFSLKNKSAIVPCTYMPFGEGHRNCIGMKFGMLSVSIGLIKILTNFEVSMSNDTPSSLSFEKKLVFINT